MPADCVLAVVSFAGHFRVLAQFFLSYALNVIDPQACSLLVMVSTREEASSLSTMLHSTEYGPRLAVLLQQLTVVDLPSALVQLSPRTATTLPTAKNRGAHGRLYVCVKKAYAVRYAHEVLNAELAIVTDSEAYVWKPLSIAQLFRNTSARPSVWYADAPAHSRPLPPARSTPHAHKADVFGDSNAAKMWCSIHVFEDARKWPTRRALHEHVPADAASLFEYMLFAYPRRQFRAYWESVETRWHRPWFDAVVAAHEAEPRCVGVGFWLEVSWHLYLYGHHRHTHAFLNVTAAIQASFGERFVLQGAYVHARLELLWRAVSNTTAASFRDFYARQPLPLFRYEHRARGHCLPLRLLASLPAPAASLQVNSAVPNWVFSACAKDLAQMPRHNTSAPWPWVRHSTATR